jgi:hypothetical protein
MAKIYFQDRVVNAELTSNTRDRADAYAGSGYYADSGVDLTEDELDALNDKCGDQIQEIWWQDFIEGDFDFDMER